MIERLKNLSKKQRILFLAAGIVLLAIIIIISSIAAAEHNKIDLSDVYTIKVEGLDTQGTASSEINKKSIETVLIGKNIDIFRADMFIDSIKCTLSKKDSLNNGDKITAKLTFDGAVAKQLNLSFKNAEKEINVSGLAKGKEVDVFEDIEVSFSGTSPDGHVSVINKSKDPFVSQVTFTPSKKKVANGDKITLDVGYDAQEAITQKVIVKQEKKEYTVSGLPEYLRNSSQLSENIVNQLNKVVEKSVNSYVSQNGAFFINHIPNRISNQYYTLGDDYSCKNTIPKKADIITEKADEVIFYNSFKSNAYCVISSTDIYAKGKNEGTTYIVTIIKDVIINNDKIDVSSVDSTQQDSLEKAQQYIEDSYAHGNIEPYELK